MGQICASKATDEGGDKDRQRLQMSNIDARSPHGLVVVLNPPEHQSDILIHQSSEPEQKNQQQDDDHVVFQIRIGKAVESGDAVGPPEDIQGFDDPGEKQGVHQCDNREIDPPQSEARQQQDRANQSPRQARQRDGQENGAVQIDVKDGGHITAYPDKHRP
ncbi:MAG: hypothetical protein ACD_75C02089G0001, partial [uncultured bacterium]